MFLISSVNLFVIPVDGSSLCRNEYYMQQHLFKTTAEQLAPGSSLRSTPILNRLRNRPDDNTTAASSSSSNSASESVLVSTKSKTKQTTRTKKRGYPSKNK